MALQQILARCDHVLDHLIEAVKLSPGFPVRVEAAHALGYLTVKEKMIEQHDGIDLSAAQYLEEFFLPV